MSIVCVIHGDEFQSHDKFLERLQKLSLPRLLGDEPNHMVIKKYPMHWPSGLKNVDALSERLCKSLADSVLGKSFASSQEINGIFCKYPDPIIVHTHLLTEDWQHQGFEILNKLLEFWQNWPDLMLEQKLIVFVFIKYQVKRQEGSKRYRWRQLLSFCWKSFSIEGRYRRTNNKIYKHIESLAASNFKQFNRLSGIVLPELTGVSRMYVENWVRDELTKQFVGEEMVEKLMREVEKMFNSWQKETLSNAIPMEDLANNLIRLLKLMTVTTRE